MNTMPAVEFKNVDIMFGKPKQAKEALELLDQGGTRETILAECGAVLGVADASIVRRSRLKIGLCGMCG